VRTVRDEASGEWSRSESATTPDGETIFQNSPAGIAVAELGARFVMANPAFQKMTGFTEPELLELTPMDLVEEGDRPAARARLDQLLTGAVREYQAEKRYRRKDGSLIWVRASVSLVAADNKSPVYVLAIIEDITARKKAEDEVQKQHEILQKIFDHIPLMINFIGADGRIKMVNREWEKTLGWTLEEIESREIDVLAELYPDPRERQKVIDYVHEAACEWVDFRPRIRDGSLIDTSWFDVRLSDGTTVGIGAEITEQKRTAEALRESEQKFRQLAGHIREVLWMLDIKADRLLYVSPSYERVWGRTVESLYQDRHSFIEAIHPEDRQHVLEAIKQLGQVAASTDIEYRVIHPDGSVCWIQDQSFPVRDASGEVYRIVGIAEDITDRRATAERLRRSEAYLAESERLGHIGSWALKIPTREIVFWSRENYRIFGFDPSVGQPTLEAVLARIHPEDRHILEIIDRALGEPKDFDLTCRILLPDGSVRYIHSLGRPVVNAAGELVNFNGVCVDITEHSVAEDALRHSKDQLRALAARVESIREQERTRLAREIHDELGQLLTGLKMELKVAMSRAWSEDRRARDCQAMMNLIDDAIGSVRRIATELRPGILDDLGLVAAVEWAAQEFAARTGTRCTLQLPSQDLAIDPESATALYRIFQEALTNIARHAEAKQFSVRVVQGVNGVSLELRDDGKGFDESQLSTSESLGILGMTERAALLGGRLTIRSSPGEGVTVTAWVPAQRIAGNAK
jgi:PAS domain S-box-containing protein